MISICIPTYPANGNAPRLLTDLLDSIRIQQGVTFEVIIGDNSPGDDIKNLCLKYPYLDIAYYRNLRRIGVSENTNFCIENVTSDFVKPMYMDDKFISPLALKEFETALEKKPWAVSDSHAMNERGTLNGYRRAKWNDQLIQGANTIGMPSCIAFRRNRFTFDPRLTTLLDCEYYWLLYGEFGEPEYIRKPLVAQRFWPGQFTKTNGNKAATDYLYLKAKHSI